MVKFKARIRENWGIFRGKFSKILQLLHCEKDLKFYDTKVKLNFHVCRNALFFNFKYLICIFMH